jgi:hypothetical protein
VGWIGVSRGGLFPEELNGTGLEEACFSVEAVFFFPVSGGYGEDVPPVPIPNTVVKVFSADDTRGATLRENRSPPEYKQALGPLFIKKSGPSAFGFRW